MSMATPAGGRPVSDRHSIDGPETGAADNAAANAAPEVGEDVLGTGDLSQPRTGAETPVDAEDLVHAQGQDVTPATLAGAQEALDAEGRAVVERVLPTRPDEDVDGRRRLLSAPAAGSAEGGAPCRYGALVPGYSPTRESAQRRGGGRLRAVDRSRRGAPARW